MKVFFNDRIVDESKAKVSVFDHGFLYGDGLYETVRANPKTVFFWREHFQRLRAGARELGLQLPWTSEFLQEAILKVIRANRVNEVTLRLTITRGEGPLGLDPRHCKAPTLVIQMHPQRPIEEWRKTGVSIGIVRARRIPPECIHPSIKSLSALSLVQAKQEAIRMKVFEGILLNTKGQLAEGATSSLFFVRRGVLHTPALSCGILPGITREHVLAKARHLRIPFREGQYLVPDLQRADEVFITNVSLGVMPVIQIVYKSGRSFHSISLPIGAMTKRLES